MSTTMKNTKPARDEKERLLELGRAKVAHQVAKESLYEWRVKMRDGETAREKAEARARVALWETTLKARRKDLERLGWRG